MYWIITLLLSIWTLYVGLNAHNTPWDSIILLCWIAWPLYLTCILIYARQKSSDQPFWRCQHLPDYLLTGAFIPLVLGISYFNIKVTSNIQSEAITFEQNLLFVGFFSVALWCFTAIAVFIFYLVAKFKIKNKIQSTQQ